jgi:hypothetical protein
MLSFVAKRVVKVGSKPPNSYSVLPRSSSTKYDDSNRQSINRGFSSYFKQDRRICLYPTALTRRCYFRTQSTSSEAVSGQSPANDLPNAAQSTSSSVYKTSTEVPREEQPRDPWRVGLGSWYSPEIKRRAVAQQIAERDAALPKHICSTPPSLPYPSNEAESRLLTEMHEMMISTPPSEFASQLTPYWETLDYYKQLSAGNAVAELPEVSKLSLQLPLHFQSLPSPSPPVGPNESSSEVLNVIAMVQSAPYIDIKNQSSADSTETPETSSNATSMSLNELSRIAETSSAAIAQVLPALVEADVYYAAETLTHVLRARGALELSASLIASLNPRQTSALLPAMCRVNPTWREDGFFDLMVEVLSTGGILRWEPSDIAAVIRDLPKVSIAADYYTSPELDPSNPENEHKTPKDLLQTAQAMARENDSEPRWDRSSYGLPGDFFLSPSKQDVEAALREYEETIEDRTDEDSAETFAKASGRSDTIDRAQSASSESQKSGDSHIFQKSDQDKAEANSNTEQIAKDEDDLLAFLDVSRTVAPEVMPDVVPIVYEPAYYNPIAWQPEEIGRLVGTMLSQELELDDIVEVLSNLALEGWKEEANGAPWHAYMGYFSTVVSDALAANKHWVDEDYTWVLHDVITNVGPWALRQWPDYRTEEHQQWLADLVAQTAIKYGRFTHDYRLIQVMLNMICDNWPEHEHQKLADLIALRMKPRTVTGRAGNWFKWRVSGRYKERFSDQRAAQSSLWLAPYNVGENPKLPELVQSQGLREPTFLEKVQKSILETDDQRLTAPSRKGTKPNNELVW